MDLREVQEDVQSLFLIKGCEKDELQGIGAGKVLAAQCQEVLCKNAVKRLSIGRETENTSSEWAQDKGQERYSAGVPRKRGRKDMRCLSPGRVTVKICNVWVQ